MEKYLIIGLGNPGLKYRKTRHNMGFMAIDYISQHNNIKVKKSKCKALVGEFFINGAKIILAKPQTFMNNSGESVLSLMEYFNIDEDKLIVIYDDLDIEMGKIRIRQKGSAGSHNGMKSIISHLKTNDFMRVRIGIKKPMAVETVPYVLGKVNRKERPNATEAIANAGLACEEIVENGYNSAINRYNKK